MQAALGTLRMKTQHVAVSFADDCSWPSPVCVHGDPSPKERVVQELEQTASANCLETG